MIARLPEHLTAPDGLVVRRILPEDAAALDQAIAESLEHLRPWMPWVADEPLGIERRRERIAAWERAWLAGDDVYMGVFVDGRLAGGAGLHRRIGPGGVEIGYWTHPAFLRNSVATRAARLLTDGAFASPEISRTEIHHDEANRASGGVPRKLGYRLVQRRADEPLAPGESGIEWIWRVERSEWCSPAGPQ